MSDEPSEIDGRPAVLRGMNHLVSGPVQPMKRFRVRWPDGTVHDTLPPHPLAAEWANRDRRKMRSDLSEWQARYAHVDAADRLAALAAVVASIEAD